MKTTPGEADDSREEDGCATQNPQPVLGPPPHYIPTERASQSDTDESDNVKRWTNDPPMFWVTLAGVIAVVAYTSVAAWQACLTRDQLTAAADQLTLTFPPRLKVTSFQMWEDGKGAEGDRNSPPPRWITGTRIAARIGVVNEGREFADIIKSDCLFYWSQDGHLPMARPYFNHFPRNEMRRLTGGEHGEAFALAQPGDIGIWSISDVMPPNLNVKTLFIVGEIVYKDRLGTYRGTFFARKYDPKRGYFVPAADNPDYENED